MINRRKLLLGVSSVVIAPLKTARPPYIYFDEFVCCPEIARIWSTLGVP